MKQENEFDILDGDEMTPDQWAAMRNNVSRVVHSLEVCWKCQNVSECGPYVLGHTVVIWLCQGCHDQMESSSATRPKAKRRSAPARLSDSNDSIL